jgi:hypothetical protein
MYLAEFNNAFTKDVRKSFDNGFNMRMEQSAYTRIFSVADTTEGTEKFNSTESIELPSFLSESETLPVSKLGKGYVTVFTGDGFGDRIIISKEARLNAKDNTTVLATLINREKVKALDAHDKFIEKRTHLFLNNPLAPSVAFQNKTVNLLSPDAEPFLSTTHVFNSTGQTFSNLLPANAFSIDVIREVERRG